MTSLDGLYITDLCEAKIAVHSGVKNEMEEFRTTRQLKLCIFPLYNITGSILKLCYLNARSVHRHFQDLRGDLNYSSTDINIFAETRCSSQDPDDLYHLAGYNLFHNDSHNFSNGMRPCGGIAVYSKVPYVPGYPFFYNVVVENSFIKNIIYYSRRTELRTIYIGIEITVIKIITLEDWTIIGIYRSPKVPVRQLCEALTELLNIISPHNNIFLGDFNINCLVEAERRPLYNLLVRDKHYKQLISTYTTDNKTLIDHIFTNITHLDIQSGVLETYFTDHKAVWASFHNFTST